MGKWFKDKENYRHRSYDFRRKRNNKRILIVVVILFLIGFVIAKDLGGIRTLIQEKLDSLNFTTSKSNSVFSDYCKENIIPEYLLVWTQYSGEQNNYFGEQIITSGLQDNPYGVFPDPPKWKDGTEMGMPQYYGNLNTICRIGSRTGENVNYRYCDGLSYSKTIQKTSNTGEIQGYEKNDYIINLTLEKDSYKREQLQQGYFFYYNVIDYKCKKI